MKSEQKKAAVVAYKERKPNPGIFALRCAATGEVWVGQTPTLDTIQNRMWFTLRMGKDMSRNLQQAWNTHGDGSISFEIVEKLEDEESPLAIANFLKERVAHWRKELGAQAI